MLKSWEKFHAATGSWGVAIVAVLVMLPLAIATWLSRHCTAWNSSVDGRCAKVRPRPFQRCELAQHSHTAQLVTSHEIGAVVAFLIFLATLAALLTL